MKKPSFLQRLTGSVNLDALDNDSFGEQEEFENEEMETEVNESYEEESENNEEEQAGELPIDMYQTDDSIVIRALVAGVNPEDLDIAITRDMVTLTGHREELQEAPDENYFHRELFWGNFTRTILLPEEILIDEAQAKEKHGLLEIILPKVDKERSAKLTVKPHAHK